MKKIKLLALLLVSVLSVNVWGEDSYVKISSTDDLSIGDEYVIVSGSTYVVTTAMNSSNGLKLAAATVNTDKSIKLPTGAAIFTLGGSEGSYTLQVGNQYFSANGTGNKSRLLASKSTSGESEFSISFVANTGSLNLVTKQSSVRCLRANSTTDVRFYVGQTTTNGVVVYLYKKASNSTLEKIELSGQTTKYRVGDSFSFDGTCTATYDDGETKTVKGTVKTAPDMTTAGNKTITISYTENKVEKTASYDITVYAPNALVITTQATTKNFRVGDTFSSSGLVVQLTYVTESGLSNKSVSSPTISSPDMTSAGVKTIDVSYVGLSTSYDITVYAPIGLTITTQATKDKFFQGETFSSSGLKTKVNYSESSLDKEVTPTVSTPTMSQLGEQTITLTYTTVETSYPIYVYSVTVNKVMEHQVEGDDVIGNKAEWNVSTKKVTVGKATNYYFDKLEVDGASSSGSFSSGFTLSNPTKDVTVTATWHRLFSLTYNTMEGDPISTVTGKAYGETITLPKPTKTGYSFEGWYTNEDYSGEKMMDGTNFEITTDATIFAKWEEIIPTSIELDITEATIPWNADKEADNKIKITATVYPLDALQDVSWTAEGYTEIATVYAGSITGKSDGTAYITCKAKNHSDVKATVTVHVTHIPILTWKDATGNVVAETKATALNGGKVTMPTDAETASAQSCSSDYALFYGWSANPISNPTETEPTLVTSATDAPADHTYYAIFRNKEPKAEGYKVTTTLTAGKTYIFGAVKANASATLANNITFGAVAFTNKYNTTSPNWATGLVDLTPDTKGFITATNTSITNNCKWLLESIDDGNHKFKRGTDYLYLGTSAGSNTNGAQCGISTSGNCYLENMNATCKDAFMLHPSNSSTNILLYNTSSKYRMYAPRSYSNTMSPYVRFYEYQAADASGIKYITQCCTPLDAPANGKATNVTATSATISWNTVTNATGYQYKIGTGDWSTSSTNTSADLTDLTSGTTYTVTLRANGTGTNCDEGTETSFTFTTLYTITATVNNEDFGTAQVSLDNASWSNQVEAAPGTTIYVKATNKEGYSFSIWSVEEGGAGSFAAHTSSTTFTTGAANTTIKATFLANVKVLDHITITAPTKTDYLEGETFNPSGMTITAYWEDGTSSPLLINDVTIEPNGALTPDVTKVTISYTYEGVTKTADQTITVTPVYTVKWYVNGNAVKTLERVAEGTTYASLEKPATPADDALSTCEANKFMGWATALITKDDATEDDFNAIKLNEATATISNTCKEFHAVFAKGQESAPSWSKITNVNQVTEGTYAIISYDEKYYLGNADYSSSDGPSLSTISKTQSVIDIKDNMKWTLTISNEKIVFESNTNVGHYLWNSDDSKSIRIGTSSSKNQPSKEWTVVSNDTYGLILKNANCTRYLVTNGTTDWRDYAASSLSATNRAANLYKLSGGTSYSNFITTCKDVKSIAVQKAPTKVDYTEEETLDLTGLEVRVTYNDDSYLDITSGFTTVPANGAMLTNETKVTITYKEKTCDQDITVTPLPRKTINATAPEGGTYTVKVGDGEAQTISAATEIKDVIAGRTITMTSTADDQHQLHSTPFVVKDESEAEVKVSKSGNNYSFTMPNSDVTITAQYVPTYTITSATGLVGGTVATDKTKTSKGSTVNVTVTPDPGYNVTKVFYVKEGESAEILINDGSFSMPASNVTVYAEFEAIKYTITLNDKGNITLKENLLYNAEIDLPALTPCYGYAFEGWTATEPTDGAWTTKPAIVAQVKVTADATFYAVYSQGSEEVTNDYTRITSTSALVSGANYVFVSEGYAMNNQFTTATTYSWSQFGISDVTIINNTISSPDESIIWKIEGDNTNGYTFFNDDAQKYIGLDLTYGDLDFVSTGAAKIGITFNSNKVKLRYKTDITYPYISYYYYDEAIEVAENSGENYLYKQVINSDIIYTAQPECKTLDEALIIETEPTKTIYKKGETFDKTGIEVRATFDGGTDLADVTAFIEVDEATPLTMADEKVTISYTQDGVTATADQPVYVVDFTSIEVKEAKNIYTEGAFFDMSKLVLNAVYSSTIHDKVLEEKVESGITVEPNRALTTSDTKVTISYNGKSVDYTITVSETQPFTVIFAASNTSEYTETEASKSAGVKVPSVTACPDYTFVGWTAEEIDGTTATQPELITITQGRYYPTEDVILYPVFRGLSNPGVFRRATSLDDITDGTKVVMYSEGGYKTIAIGNSNFYGGTLPTESDNQITCNDDKMIWTVSGTTSSCQFTNGTKTIGVETLPSSNSTSLSNTTSNSQWKIRMNDTHFIIYQPYSDNTNSAYVEYYSNSWLAFKTSNTPSAASYGYLNTRIYVPAGSMIYTSTPATCDVEIEQSTIVLNAGSGLVDEDTYTLLKGESMTLPDPTFSITDWSFVGWSETEVMREITSAPTLVDNPFTPTEDVILNAIYSRPVGNGYVYKTYPSTLQRPSFSPEVGTYDEAKDVTITAGEDATIYYRKTTDQLHHVMNEDYDATVDGALEYSSAIKTSITTYIVAVAQYGDKFSDEEMYKIDFNYPATPTFSVETGSNIFKGQSVTITAPEGTLLRYKVNDGDVVELTTNTYVYTFNNVVNNITLTAYSEKSGLKSEEVSATYHIKPVPNKVTFHAGTGLIDGESTKEIYEDAANEGLILPILDAPCTNGDSWKFYGWAKATVDATTSTPTILKEGDSDCSYTTQGLRFYPTSDCELFAVYTKTTGIIELINEDFASATAGSATNLSGASTKWTGDINFPEQSLSNIYQAGGTIKMGTGSACGYLTTKQLLVPAATTLSISYDYQQYASNKDASIAIDEMNGTAETITIEGCATDGFVHKSTTLTTTVDNPTIRFMTTTHNNDLRCGLDNIVITIGTPVQNYATNPECCVHTINFSTTGEAIEPVAIPCGTGNFIALPEAKKQNCNFIKWTLNTDEYSAGDIYAYDYNRTDDVTFTAVFTEPLTSVMVENGEIKYASELPYNYNGDLCVKDGGIFVADIALTVNNFVIEVGQGHAGQVKAAKNLTIHGDAYMQLEIDPADAASPGWYAFGVPFPVDALNGVYYNNTKLTNEVGYAIMDYHGDIRAQGQYGWKKYRGILQPGVFYYLTVGDTDYKNLRFQLKKDGDYTIENAASKWENDQLKSESCRTDFYPYINSGDGQATDRGYNGVANKALENVTINTNTSMSDWVYTYNNQFKVFSTEDISESPAPVFSPATPFFVVSTANEDKSFAVTFQQLPTANAAPYLAPMAQTLSKVKVTFSNSEYTDKYYVSASEDAKNEYELGQDAVKMGTIDNNTKVPQIASINYNNTQLSAEYAQLMNGNAFINLLLYAPADGEYTIAATECKDGTIYLTQNGADIWNLKDAFTLTLTKGITYEYGLHLVANSSQTPTNINGLKNNNKAQKIFKDYNIYILRDAQMYNTQGVKVQ